MTRTRPILRRRTYLRTTAAVVTVGMAGLAGCQGRENDDRGEPSADGGAETTDTDESADQTEAETEPDSGDTDEDATDTDDPAETDDRGAESAEPIAEQVEVVSAVGRVSPAETVDEIELVVQRAVAADEIDLSALTVEFDSESTTAALSHGGDGERNELTAATFLTTHVAGDSGHDELVERSDRSMITLDAALVQDDPGLAADSTALVVFTDEAGTERRHELTVPPDLGDDEAVRLRVSDAR